MPNWLGDMIMATAFTKVLRDENKEAVIDIIVKKELAQVAALISGINTIYSFSKNETTAWKFGKQLARQKKYDFFYCLPDSFSSALMAFATGAKKRIGYKNEFRSFLFTNSFRKQKSHHRVEQYVQLLAAFTGKQYSPPIVSLANNFQHKKDVIAVNINSEAESRRLPLNKAVKLVNLLRSEITEEIMLVGSAKESAYVTSLFGLLTDTTNISNLAGTTSLQQMIIILASVKAVLTTDSGPAHIANALGTPVIVLFGAGNEENTRPFNPLNRDIIRLGKLSCEPCVSNKCKQYGVPECLLQLDEIKIINAVKKYL